MQIDFVDPNPDAREDAPYNGDVVISVRTIRVVAIRRYGGTWAAYWRPWDSSTEETANSGEKLPEEAAKFHFFPKIRGRYDG